VFAFFYSNLLFNDNNVPITDLPLHNVCKVVIDHHRKFDSNKYMSTVLDRCLVIVTSVILLCLNTT
jgi:hypothetical protein